MHSVSSNREKRWTPAEDEVLFAAVTELNKGNLNLIALIHMLILVYQLVNHHVGKVWLHYFPVSPFIFFRGVVF